MNLRSLTLPALATSLVALAFTTTPALAAAPETPANEKAASVTATTATLEAELNPSATVAVEGGEYEFEYRVSGSECEGETVAPEPGAGIAAGMPKEPESVTLTGLQPNQTYTFCLIERNAAGEEAKGLPVTFKTLPGKPTLEGEATTTETATSAVLNAQINPNGLEVTSCQFEYGTEAYVYSKQVTCAPAPGSGRTAVSVSQRIEGLMVNTEYHWRLVAANAVGTATSSDHTFVYQTTAEGLPDNRAYEMVTPPQKNGALIGDIFAGWDYEVSEGPEGLEGGPSRVVSISIQCFAHSESCTGFRGDSGEPFEFTRTSGGWETTPLAPPAGVFRENSAWLANAGEGTALFSMPTGPTGEDEWYARTSTGAFVPFGPASPPGSSSTGRFSEYSAGPTADFSHLVWEDNESDGEHWPFDATIGKFSLYEYAGAHNKEPFLVGVSNKGRPTRNTEAELISVCGASLGAEVGVVPLNALSADGRTVYFNAYGGAGCFGTGANAGREVPDNELFARVDGELPDARTLPISEPSAFAPAAPYPGCTEEPCIKDVNEKAHWSAAAFAGASTDGSKSYFLDTQQLTDDATQGTGRASTLTGCSEASSQCNLYLSDLTQPDGRRLVDVSVPVSGGEGPRVQGVVQVSTDGSHVYFVAHGRLATNESVLGQQAVSGAENLYVFDEHTGHTAFIASLSPQDNEELSDWGRSGFLTANVTPDGRFLVFESHGALTPDDVRVDPVTQIFRYDADTGGLVRISIGEKGFNDNGNAGTGGASMVGGDEPGASPMRTDPTMSNDGSYVFFQSPIALTPHALNDVVIGGGGLGGERISYAQNIYEYHEGHVYLISDGSDTSDATTACKGRASTRTEIFSSGACLLGTDATGANVYFTSGNRLVSADTDTQVDIYDARTCEPEHANPCITEPPRPLPPCDGEACHGIPAATPSLLTPGTASFNGEGNVTSQPSIPAAVKKHVATCRKGFVKNKKHKCVKRTKKKKSKAKKPAKRRA